MTDLFDFQPPAFQYAVMGNPVQHSQSPRIHQMFAQQFGLAIQYDRIQVDVGGFAQAVSHFAAQRGAGLNVTLPFKVEAWQLCCGAGNRLSAAAQAAEAVNTLQFVENGNMFGDNTDGVGLLCDLEQNLNLQLADKRVLVLGAGGAVRGILRPLLQRRPATLLIVNRTAHTAHALAEKFNDSMGSASKTNISGCGFARLHQHLNTTFDLIINGISNLGAPLLDQLTNLAPHCLRGVVAYDMAYADSPSVFMRWAEANGASTVCDGRGMLVEQAAESFLIWHGKRPATASVLDALRHRETTTTACDAP